MAMVKLLHASTILIVLILVSGISGWLIPAFYDWTGADQSRPSPLMWQVPLAVSVAALLFCGLLPWTPVKGWSEGTPRGSLQFKVRSLLVLTAVVAVTIAIGLKYPIGVANACFALAVAAALWSARLHREWRLPVAALLASLFMPFVWVLGYGELNNLLSLLQTAAGLPNIFPTALIVNLLGWNLHEGGWISIVITAIQTMVGLWLIQVGTRRAIAYILFVLLSSLMSSLILNALVRA